MSILLFVIVRLLGRFRQDLWLAVGIVSGSKLIIIVSHADRLFLGNVATWSSLSE